MQTDQTQQTQVDKAVSFGTRLKNAREALGLERGDAAAQLRLNEKYLVMMEKDRFAADLPLTFARGYLKSYAKLLQIPKSDTEKALETLKPRAGTQDYLPLPKNLPHSTTRNYMAQFFTYLIFFGLVGAAGTWWYAHPNFPESFFTENTFHFVKSGNDTAKTSAPSAPQVTTAAAVPTTATPTTSDANPPSMLNNNADVNDQTSVANTMNASTVNKPEAAVSTPDIDETLNSASNSPASGANKSVNGQHGQQKPAYMTNTGEDPFNGNKTTDNDTE